ncbi:MAG: amidohydrolase family protein [Gemmataceae bacterium]|nr:amidohydrolase family protein [Gemmataceae bacterium]
MGAPPAPLRRQRISAQWVASPGRTPIADGVIEILGDSVISVGPWDRQPVDIRLDDAIILPGLVNAHTHLDLSGAAGQTPPRPNFGQWLESVVGFRRSNPEDVVIPAIAQGITQLAGSGTTLVGDISSCGSSLPLIAASGVTGVVFRELIGLSESRSQTAMSHISRGEPLSPHAPYSFRFQSLGCLPADVPLAMHVAESPEEVKLLDHRSGPIREFLERLGAWDESGLAPSIEDVVETISNRSGPTLLIHGNYLRPEVKLPPNLSIVFCPRTHAAFGHEPHPFRKMRDLGVRVSLGTDSLASNPDLSVLNEARFLFPQFPNSDALLQMITSDGAISLGFKDRGRLEPGSRADLCAVQIGASTANPLEELFAGEGRVVATWTGGMRIA